MPRSTVGFKGSATASVVMPPEDRCPNTRSDGIRCRLTTGHLDMHRADIAEGEYIRWPNFEEE